MVTASAPMDPDVYNFLKVFALVHQFSKAMEVQKILSFRKITQANDSTSGHCGRPSLNMKLN